MNEMNGKKRDQVPHISNESKKSIAYVSKLQVLSCDSSPLCTRNGLSKLTKSAHLEAASSWSSAAASSFTLTTWFPCLRESIGKGPRTDKLSNVEHMAAEYIYFRFFFWSIPDGFREVALAIVTLRFAKVLCTMSDLALSFFGDSFPTFLRVSAIALSLCDFSRGVGGFL